MSTAITPVRVRGKYADEGREQYRAIATGSGAIDHTITPDQHFKIRKLELHLSAAGTTTENFIVNVDAGDGAVYDVVLLKRDLSVGSVVDLVWKPFENRDDLYESDDVIKITWTNTEARTWALRLFYEVP